MFFKQTIGGQRVFFFFFFFDQMYLHHLDRRFVVEIINCHYVWVHFRTMYFFKSWVNIVKVLVENDILRVFGYRKCILEASSELKVII